MSGDRFNYVIIGAGSAGCVLANRLSADGASVCLIEAGGEDSNPWIRVPAATARLLGKPRTDWCHMSLPEPGLNGRRLMHCKGKVLGGSSSINGMLYVRGHRADYDAWAELGCAGWSWNDVLPYFLKSERFVDPPSALHGSTGELSVQLPRYFPDIMRRFIAASAEAGLGRTKDYNDPDPEGLSPGQSTIAGTTRCSAAKAFLKPVRSRPNLHIETSATVRRITVTDGRVRGVVFERGGVEQSIAADEIVLSAGAVNSPRLLELSGIGQAARLSAMAIPVIHDLEGVGENLHDHPTLFTTFRTRGTVSANAETRSWRLARELVKYALLGRGVMMATPGMVAGFATVDETAASADIQIMSRPFTADPNASTFTLEREGGLAVATYPCRPRSRGSTHIQSPDPRDEPALVMNFLSHPDDVRLLLAGVALVRKIARQPAIRDYIAHELTPGADIRESAELETYLRKATVSAYHAVGTCRMGTDPRAVVDPRLRVRGLDGLRVVDASIIPRIVSANTNAATIMIAEKAAAMMIEDRGQRGAPVVLRAAVYNRRPGA